MGNPMQPFPTLFIGVTHTKKGTAVMHDYGTAECKRCGTEFRLVRKWQEFCSRTCKNRYHNERRDEAMRLLREKEAGK